MREPRLGEIWLVAMPLLIHNENGSFDTAFQIRPFLIVDEGKGVMVEENPDYLASKITTQENKITKLKCIDNWEELGLKQKSFVRIEIPERIERAQLISKISAMPNEQFIEFYKKIIELFNLDIMESIIKGELVTE